MFWLTLGLLVFTVPYSGMHGVPVQERGVQPADPIITVSRTNSSINLPLSKKQVARTEVKLEEGTVFINNIKLKDRPDIHFQNTDIKSIVKNSIHCLILTDNAFFVLDIKNRVVSPLVLEKLAGFREGCQTPKSISYRGSEIKGIFRVKIVSHCMGIVINSAYVSSDKGIFEMGDVWDRVSGDKYLRQVDYALGK